MNWPIWDTLSARAKLQLYEKAADALRDSTEELMSETSKFVIIELAFSTYDPHCLICDEQRPSLMTVDLGHLATDKNNNYILPVDMPDKRILEDIDPEELVCCFCIEEQRYSKPTDYYKPDSSIIDQNNLTSRREILNRIDALKGAPTMDNDDLIEELIEQVKSLEDQLLQTCEGCGGEKAHPELGEVILIPTNGWCAMELPECEVIA